MERSLPGETKRAADQAEPPRFALNEASLPRISRFEVLRVDNLGNPRLDELRTNANAGVCRRTYSDALDAYLTTLKERAYFNIDYRGPACDVDSHLTQKLQKLGVEAGPERSEWISHMGLVARTTEALLQSSGVHLILQTVPPSRPTDIFSFHVDTLALESDLRPIRALCTYAGPGTEWIPEYNLKREDFYRWLAEYSARPRIFHRKPKDFSVPSHEIERLQHGEVAYFYGEKISGYGRGVPHRRPFSRQHRIFMTIDGIE